MILTQTGVNNGDLWHRETMEILVKKMTSVGEYTNIQVDIVKTFMIHIIESRRKRFMTQNQSRSMNFGGRRFN